MTPMASAAPLLLLLLLLGAGAQPLFPEFTETTETTTTETTTTETTTTETTARTTARRIPGTAAGTPTGSKNSSSDGGSRPPVSFPAEFQPHNGTGGSTAPTSATGGNGSSSTQAGPSAPSRTPTAAGGSSGAPDPSKAAALPPGAERLLLRVPLSFRILNRNFSESLRDPASRDYQSLQYRLLAVFQRVFGCASCMGSLTYKGCSQLQFSRGSVAVQSTLVFGHGNGPVSSDAAAQQLRQSLDPNGFIMDLQLDSIQSSVEVTPAAPVPAVPDWAIALLVLVCVLLLLSLLTCLLLVTCSCHRKSRGKLDLFSTKDSYHPMAEYPPYQSHGRYVAPNSKPKPYSQVAGSNGTGTGTFTYTNPAAPSDNL